MTYISFLVIYARGIFACGLLKTVLALSRVTRGYDEDRLQLYSGGAAALGALLGLLILYYPENAGISISFRIPLAATMMILFILISLSISKIYRKEVLLKEKNKQVQD